VIKRSESSRDYFAADGVGHNDRTTIQVGTQVQAPRTYNSRGSLEKRQQQWISLCWIMLSLAGEEPIPLAGGTIALEKRDFFDPLRLSLSIFMFLWFK